MKRGLCGFLAWAVLAAAVQCAPYTLAVDSGSVEEEITTAADGGEAPLTAEDVRRANSRTNRFLVRGAEPVEAGDVLGGNQCVSSRPLQTNCEELKGFFIVELEEQVIPVDFISLLRDEALEIYPDSGLSFASVDSTAGEDAPPVAYALEEELDEMREADVDGEVLIALLDNGVDIFHKDLQDNLVDGWDVYHDSANTAADGATFGQAHGTHIAGIIASVAPEAKIMPIQISEYGVAYVSTVIEGIRYAEDHGAVLANCSWTTEEYCPLLEKVMADSPLFFVVAAGNDGRNMTQTPVYPASFGLDNVISVASVGRDGQLSYFSSYGPNVDIAAWGDEVESAKPGNTYGTLSGTSMAAAHVSGAAALALSAGVQVSELKEALKESADKIEAMVGFTDQGNVLSLYGHTYDLAPEAEISASAAVGYSARNGKAIDIFGGRSHYNVLTDNGEILSWGQGGSGQLCNGTRTDSKTPVKSGYKYEKEFMFNETGDSAHLCGGSDTVFLVSPSGEAYGWGENDCKQIQNPMNLGSYVTSPYRVFMGPIKDIAAGSSFALYQMLDGKVWRFGNDLGYKTGTWNYNASGAELTEFQGARAVAAGSSLALILLESGDVQAWGELSKNTDAVGTTARVYEPVSLMEGSSTSGPKDSYKDIVGAGDNGILLTTDNCINTTQKRAQISSSGRTYTRRVVGSRTSDIVQIECGRSGEIALDSRGQVWISGGNSYGQAGHGTVSEWAGNASMTAVPGLSNIVRVAATDYSFAALQDDGTVWVWGSNLYGELGNGGKDSYSAVPVKVSMPVTYGAISEFEKVVLKPPFGTAAEDLDLPGTVNAKLTDWTTEALPVVWDLTGYDPEKVGESQTFSGVVTFPDDLRNPSGAEPQLEIIVQGEIVGNRNDIKNIPALSQEIGQNIYLAPTDKIHAYGTPDTASLPETAVVELAGGGSAELAVRWDTGAYDPSRAGLQTLTGEVVIPEDSDITNSKKIKATIEITVLPRQYEVWEAAPTTISMEILTGSTLDQISEQLRQEGKSALSVRVADLSSDVEVLTFCDICLTEEDNPEYNSSRDIPGEYVLTARLPENFTPLAEDIPGPITVRVTSSRVDIASTELARMEAPQSVFPTALEGIPTQVNAVLENGMTIPVDVEWDWRQYIMDRNTVGEHIILGTLVNLPPMAKQPEGEEITATMVVDVYPVNYTVSGVLGDNMLEADAGLTLEEITALLSPALELEITSVDHEPEITAAYEAEVALETEKNPDFDPEWADIYVLKGTLALPSNISCPENGNYDEILLQTNAVEVIDVEPAYVLTVEGTAFEDIAALPDRVTVTLSCAGTDGVGKKISSGVDWGVGEGYDPLPTEWREDGTALMEVTGTLKDYPQYVNGAGVKAKLYITVTQAFDVVEITPSRFPAQGAMEVKLGSSLEEIYNQLETHSVVLTLENSRKETSTANSTFQLRPEDNPDYDPLTEGTYTLKGYIPLEDVMRNPKGLMVEIVVRTVKYNITNTKVTRVSGVVSGTPFEEVGLPSLAPVVRNDGETEEIPVTWDGSKYNPTKIGSQVVRGTLVVPLPVHLENPNNRQPNAVVTIVDPSARILSLEQLPKSRMLLALEDQEEETFPGLVEYRYLARLLRADGSVSTEIISVFVETEE